MYGPLLANNRVFGNNTMNKIIYVGSEYNILRFSETFGTGVVPVWLFCRRLHNWCFGWGFVSVLKLFLFVLRAICDYGDMSIRRSRRYIALFVARLPVPLIEWLTHYDPPMFIYASNCTIMSSFTASNL